MEKIPFTELIAGLASFISLLIAWIIKRYITQSEAKCSDLSSQIERSEKLSKEGLYQLRDSFNRRVDDLQGNIEFFKKDCRARHEDISKLSGKIEVLLDKDR